MQISPEGGIGIGLALLGLMGSGAIMIYPTHYWIGWTLIAAAIVGLTCLGAQYFELWHLKIIPLGGMVASGIAFVGFAVWYFWQFEPLEMQSTTNSTPAELVGQASAYFYCVMGWWPAAEADREALNIQVLAFGNNEPTIGFGPGPTVPHNHQNKYSSVAPIKCEMTFYGDTPIFNIEVPITVDVYEVIRPDKNSNRNGEFIKSITIKVPIAKLELPGQKILRFYVYSFDYNAFVAVRYPEKFTYKTLNAEGRSDGKILTPDMQPIMVGPSPSSGARD